MRVMNRQFAAVMCLCLALGVTVGFASPASAAYSNEPKPMAWTAPGPVHATTVSGGLVYVGYNVPGTATGGVVALDASTGVLVWSAATNADVRALAVSDDGSRVLAGGAFTSVNGLTRRHLVALDAANGALLAWKPNAAGMVRDIVVNGDTVYVGGTFAKLGGVAQRGLGAVSLSTGERVESFTASVDDKVFGLAKVGSTLIASGKFELVNETVNETIISSPRASLAAFDLEALDEGEQKLTSWAPARLCSSCNTYWDIAADGENAYVASSGRGGYFGAFDLGDGHQPWPALRADGDVQAVTVSTDGLVYIGGHFAQYVGGSSNPRSLLAAVDPLSGTLIPGFAPKLFSSYPGVWALASTDATLFVGGDFTGVLSGGANNRIPYLAAF